MDDVKIVETINKESVPKQVGRVRLDYSKILRSVATLNNTECLVLEVDGMKKHRVSGIKKAIAKEFPTAKYKVISRTNKKDGIINIYIHK